MRTIDDMRKFIDKELLVRPALNMIAGHFFGLLEDRIRQVEREVGECYVELPKDADGVPWHVGDVNENGRTITTMCLTAHGWHFSNIQNDIDPSLHRHHHEPTVEDVLWDFAERWHDAKRGERTFDYNALVAEFAAKLRLAGDAE